MIARLSSAIRAALSALVSGAWGPNPAGDNPVATMKQLRIPVWGPIRGTSTNNNQAANDQYLSSSGNPDFGLLDETALNTLFGSGNWELEFIAHLNGGAYTAQATYNYLFQIEVKSTATTDTDNLGTLSAHGATDSIARFLYDPASFSGAGTQWRIRCRWQCSNPNVAETITTTLNSGVLYARLKQ